MSTVPSAADALLRSGGIPAGVTTLSLGGEPLPPELADALYARGIARVYDLYGPSEDTTYSTWALRRAGGPATIGRPIANTRAYVLGAGMRPEPPGVAGELYLGGRGLARGYLGRPALTAGRFVPDPFSGTPGARLYRTGDRVRWRADGTLEYLGRLDHQVKVRGFRVEPGEVEAALRRHAGVRDCVVAARDDLPGEVRLAAWVVGEANAEALRAHLRATLPEHLVPAAFVRLDALPRTPNGKLDRRALPAPEYAAASPSPPPRDALEEQVAAVWRGVLGVDVVGVHDNFFDLGGSSLRVSRVFARLRELRGDLRMVDLFEHTTVEAVARFLRGGAPASAPARTAAPTAVPPPRADAAGDAVAVVGMACRFPGARDTAEFWRNLCAGVESVRTFSDHELLEAGADPAVVRDRSRVRAYGVLDDAYAFDAGFFGVSPREAQVIDPQHRVFLECAWSALEDAGVDPARFAGDVGVYAGSGSTSTHLARVQADPELAGWVSGELAMFGSGVDFLTTRVSYRLGLHGPSLAVQTACSTSLVAVHLACRALLGGECDLALAGGVTIAAEQVVAYRFQPGGILSPDGHCRAFDARAAGTVDGSGAGVVALKRLSDALRDGDTIHAVVRGSAINNDGAGKIGFTAPSVAGQARAIRQALAAARVDASTISCVETHGTG
ncbi:MAG TPA: beta-ketoacyl synthase N-terminal-like domain-containing protein, partial [Gemmatimonadaceae bacterium]